MPKLMSYNDLTTQTQISNLFNVLSHWLNAFSHSTSHILKENFKHPAKTTNELGPAWQNIAGNLHIHGQK